MIDIGSTVLEVSRDSETQKELKTWRGASMFSTQRRWAAKREIGFWELTGACALINPWRSQRAF